MFVWTLPHAAVKRQSTRSAQQYESAGVSFSCPVYDNAQTINAARRIVREWTQIERTAARKLSHRESNSTDLLYLGIVSKASRNSLAKIPSRHLLFSRHVVHRERRNGVQSTKRIKIMNR